MAIAEIRPKCATLAQGDSASAPNPTASAREVPTTASPHLSHRAVDRRLDRRSQIALLPEPLQEVNDVVYGDRPERRLPPSRCRRRGGPRRSPMAPSVETTGSRVGTIASRAQPTERR